LEDDDNSPIAAARLCAGDPPTFGEPMSDVLNGVAPLPHLGVLRVEGADALHFLQGQLTQDFELVRSDAARLAAYCNPKGRMLASFVGLRRGDGEALLVMSRDILEATRKRLSMFVLRAKAKLSDASADYVLYGLAGDVAVAAAPGAEPWTRADAGTASGVRLYPADGQPRALWLAPAGTPAPAGPALDPARWLWGEVRSGVATVTAPIVEAFVPQMLNYESVGGVNFKKGCYPGQEVVARSQFRGTLKRRAFLAHSTAPMQAGVEVFHEADREQPCGVVAQAAAAPRGGWDAIISIQLNATEGGRLMLGSADGAALSLAATPYPLLADV
jgi:tRNA-modifying protein YgfZ